MKNSNYKSLTEYEITIRFFGIGCNYGCAKRFRERKIAELREAFQAFSRSELDIF